MGTISAKKIESALAKAKDVGVVEEPLTIGETAIVLRNLRPDEYIAIYKEAEELEGIDAMYGFQKGHVCRSIVELNGVDLRDVDFVEVEEEVKDPKTGEVVLDQNQQPKIKKVKLERHEYIRKHVLGGWTKEPIQVAFRKFNDVLKLAEDKSKEGVKFLLPEMTPEEKFRDVIGNIREVIDEVPVALVDSILEEAGLMRISRADEIKRAMEATDQLAREQEAAAQQTTEAPPEQAPQGPQPVQVPLTGAPPTGPRVRQPTAEEIMARRSPLNRQAVEIPNPNPQPTIASPTPHGRAVHGPPMPPPQASGQEVVAAAKRNQLIGQIEEQALAMEDPLPPPGDPSMAQRHVVPGQPPPAAPGQPAQHMPNAPHLQVGTPPNAPVLEKKGAQFDAGAFERNLNKPPTSGINPRFRPAR